MCIRDSYNISAGSIEKVLAHMDVILSAAMEDWNNTTNHAALRCPPMIFPLPTGQDSNTAEFAIILKMDNDGDTVVYSPIDVYKRQAQPLYPDTIDYAPLENNAEFLIYEGANAVGKGRVLGRTVPYQVKQQRK